MQFIPSFLFLSNFLHLKFQQCCSCPAYPSLKSLSILHNFWISIQSIVFPVKHTWHFVSHHSFSHLGLLSLPVQTSHLFILSLAQPHGRSVSAALPSGAPRATTGTGKAVMEAAGLWNQSAPALWVFQSAERNRTHLPATFGEGVKRKSNDCAKCQMNSCLDYLCCPSGHDLWFSCAGSAG